MSESKEKCQGKTKKGNRCQRSALKNSSYCYAHKPVNDEVHLKMDDVCPICLEEGEEMFQLNCGHRVHLDCIKEVAHTGCVLCRTPMTNLPKEIINQILDNEKNYKEELEEEDRVLAEQTSSTIELSNLFSIYIRPPPQIEMKYAMLYLKSQGIPLKYLPEKIKILTPTGHPNPPYGMLFSLLVSQTLERMKEDLANNFSDSRNSEEEDSREEGSEEQNSENDSSESSSSESIDSEEDYFTSEEIENPFENQDNNLRYIRRAIERISVNPSSFNPLDLPVVMEDSTN